MMQYRLCNGEALTSGFPYTSRQDAFRDALKYSLAHGSCTVQSSQLETIAAFTHGRKCATPSPR